MQKFFDAMIRIYVRSLLNLKLQTAVFFYLIDAIFHFRWYYLALVNCHLVVGQCE